MAKANEIERLGFRVQEEIVTRARSEDWWGLDNLLPDPDQVAYRKGYSMNEWITVLRFLLTDSQVQTCQESRQGGTLDREWEIVEPEGGKAQSRRRAFKVIKELMEVLEVHQIIEEMLDAPFFGMAPMEIVWKRGPLWLPDRIVGKPPEWFAFDANNELKFLSRDNLITGEDLPPMKFLLPRFKANYLNPYGERLLSRCFWPITWKRAGQKFWGMFVEKYGMPWPVGKVPRNATKEDRENLRDSLVGAVQDAVFVINDDESVDFGGGDARGASSDIYRELIKASDQQISKVILGQTLTTEPGGEKGQGSYSLGKVQKGELEERQGRDQRMIKKAFDRLFAWICELNFMGAAAPKFGWYEDEDLQKERAERDDMLAKSQGLQFTKEYYVETYNLDPNHFEIVKQDNPQKVPESEGGLPGQGAPDSGADAKDDEKKKPGEFAEGDSVWGFSTVDDIAGKMAGKGQKAFEKTFKPVFRFLKRARSLEQFRDGLLDVYPKLNGEEWRELLTRAMLASSLVGNAAVADEAEEDSEFAQRPDNQGTAGIWWEQGFSEQIEFFAQKGYRISPNSWKDVWQDEHAHAFTVARVTEMDVLRDIRKAVDKAIATGWSYEDFARHLEPILRQKGWWADDRKDEKIVLPSGEERKRLAPYRLEIIYETNLAVAYQTGRWKQIQEVKPYRPWLVLNGVSDDRTRPSHRSLWGKVWHADDGVWDSLYPPLDWNCRCYVKTLSNRQLKARGLKPEKSGWPMDYTTGKAFEPGEGWNYNPGKAGLSAWQPKLDKYTDEERRMLRESLEMGAAL